VTSRSGFREPPVQEGMARLSRSVILYIWNMSLYTITGSTNRRFAELIAICEGISHVGAGHQEMGVNNSENERHGNEVEESPFRLHHERKRRKFFSFLNRDSDFGRAIDALRRIVSVLIAVDRLASSLQPIQDTHLKTKGDLKTTKQQLVKFST
jgi:hypothetical protein